MHQSEQDDSTHLVPQAGCGIKNLQEEKKGPGFATCEMFQFTQMQVTDTLEVSTSYSSFILISINLFLQQGKTHKTLIKKRKLQ